jgi:glycosyltransferase involved in cell wall biosynthesis
MKSLPDYKLVIVAKSTPFLSRALAPFDQTRIHLLENLNDTELVSVYKNASLLVTPSYMEGYGLVGLEALMVGTKVVASNIPVYREVYGNQVTYFDPTTPSDLVSKIKSTLNTKSKTFKFDRTWDDVAKGIAEVIHARMSSL